MKEPTVKKHDGTLLQIAQLGHPVLREKAHQIRDIKEQNIQQLINDMIATVMDVDGVGLAAPQVYAPYRIFIIASHPNARYPYAPDMPPTAVINPNILTHSDVTEKDWEGCLSIPGVRGLIPRYKEIEVEYLNRDGKRVKTQYADFLARIFQHESDHLDGIVFFDRLETTKDIFMEKEYQKIIARKKITPA